MTEGDPAERPDRAAADARAWLHRAIRAVPDGQLGPIADLVGDGRSGADAMWAAYRVAYPDDAERVLAEVGPPPWWSALCPRCGGAAPSMRLCDRCEDRLDP